MKVCAKGWRLAAFGGNTIALEWSDAGAGEWARQILGFHPCAAPGEPVAVYRLHTCKIGGGLTVYNGARCLCRSVEPSKAVHAVMEAMMRLWTQRCDAGLMLHAALMSKRGRGMLIPGVSGSGKSSLSAWLIRQGWSCHGDEQAHANASDWNWEGFVRPFFFKNDWASVFPTVVTSPEAVLKVGAQTLVPARFFGQKVLPAISVRPGILLFPTFGRGSAFSLQRLSAGQATMRLVQSILNGGNLINRGVAQAAGIARRCPGYQLTYGGFDQLSPLLELLEVSSAEAEP